MLSHIRNAANSFIIRLLLAMIAFTFVGWSIKDILQAKNNYDLVTFSNAKNITENDFLKAKLEEISMLQKQSGTNLSNEDIKELDLDRVVLHRLINDNILYYIASYYNFNLSEEAVIYFVKQSPVFKNQQGEFDVTIFKSILKNSNFFEKEYLKDLKEKMLRNTIITTFTQSFKTPDMMVQNVVDYMAEKRLVNLVHIDLKTPVHNINPSSLTRDEVFEFYQTHKELFTTLEKRNFLYLKVSADLVAQKIEINKSEILDFYSKNKEEFGDNFNKVKKKVSTALKQQKTEELMLEFAKNLEDDVAAGSTLKEIAEKYELQLIEMKDMSYNDLVSEKTSINIAANTIFEMSEGEVLYPIELHNKEGLLLVELSIINPSRTLEFNETEGKARILLNERLLAKANLKIFENTLKNFKTNYKSIVTSSKKLNKLGIKIDAQFSITRAAAEKNDKLPQGLLVSIFQNKKAEVTPIFRVNNKAYFAYIKQIKIDKDKTKNIKKSVKESIDTSIKNGIIEELIAHFIKKNEMKINFRDKAL